MVAQVQGVLPEGKHIPHDQGHAAMPTCLGHVEETLVLVSGPGPGSSLPPRNAVVSYINHQGGLRSRPLYKLARQILVWSQDKFLSLRAVYSWASQCRSRHSVEAGAEARGMEASPRGGEADLESFWPGTGGSVCDSSDIALSPLVLSDSSSSVAHYPSNLWGN